MRAGYFKIIILAICIISASLAPASNAEDVSDRDDDQCLNCHNDIWMDAQSKLYIHKPVRAADCRYCHVARLGAMDAVTPSYLKNVNWVARGAGSSRLHWLEFTEGKRGATLLVEARWPGGQIRKEIALPRFEELAELPANDSEPPRITNVRVLKVARGLFQSVTIGWDTDKPADSLVEYGLTNLSQKSMQERQLTRHHAVTLIGMEDGKTYKYRVFSSDIGGRQSVSSVHTLKVELNASPMIPEVTPEEPSGKMTLSVDFYRLDERSLVKVEANREIQVRLGLLPKKYADQGGQAGVKVLRHPLLNSEEVTNTGICYTCHLEYKKILTHPINVYPNPGMVIPPEYATLSDGRISCMSCHAVHASNEEFRVIKANKRDLCRGCHRDML